jgi:HK97 family phage major capsid protein
MPETNNAVDPIARFDAALAEDRKQRADEQKKISDAQAEALVRLDRLEKSNATQTVSGAKDVKFQIMPVVRGLSTGRWDGYEKIRDEGMEALKTRDMSVATASGGGYITPAVYSNQMTPLLTEEAQLTKMGITVITGVKGKTLTFPRLTSGVSVAYLAENIALSATAPVFDQDTVAPHIAGAYSAMSRLLAENADPAAEQIVRSEFSRKAALFADQTGYFGTGSGSNPEGLFNNANVAVSSKATAITLDHCLDMISAVEARNGIVDAAKTGFRMHPALWGKLRKAKGSTNDHYILSNDPSSPTKRSIQGYPVYVSTQMEIETGGTDSAYACVFGDHSQLVRFIWNDVIIETTNVGGDSFVKHQILVKLVWADDWFVKQPDSFEVYTDLYAA